MTVPVVDPAWAAARNGMPGDQTAVDQASQVAQFLASHGVAAVYQGNQVVTPAASGATSGAAFSWLADGDNGWLPAFDVDQPFVVPAGVTTIGRIEVAALPVGQGGDLRVTLYPDNGSGAPNLAAPIVSTVIPADHIAALAAPLGLASGGPLATPLSNTLLPGQRVTVPWTQPASSINGAPTYATPVTSGNWTLFIAGFDAIGNVSTAAVTAAQYLGNGTVSGAIPQQALPLAVWNNAAAATADTVIVAGGINSANAAVANVWTASWDPSTGTLGAWAAQAALPVTNWGPGMAAWGSTVYVAGGASSTTTVPLPVLSSVYWATVQNGQITAWNVGPPLPQPLFFPFIAAINGWLIVAGGFNLNQIKQTCVYYAPINSDGSLGSWQAGPPLPQASVPGGGPMLSQAVTDSALIIVGANPSPPTTGVWVLTVTDDGPGLEWQVINWNVGTYLGPQIAAYPSGQAGSWELVVFQSTSYAVGPMTPVPIISVPLPASGLTPGNTYHLLFQQQSSAN